jgi:hypothetical protein
MQGEMCEEFVKSYKFIKHKLYDIRVKRSKSRSCLHGKAFELDIYLKHKNKVN